MENAIEEEIKELLQKVKQDLHVELMITLTNLGQN